MKLLPDYQGPVAFHLDGDDAVSHGVIVRLRFRQLLPDLRTGCVILSVTPGRTGRPVQPARPSTRPGASRYPACRSGYSADPRPVVVLPAIERAPDPRVKLGQGQIERRNTILGGRLGPDGRAARPDRQFHTLLLAGLAGVALDREFDVHADGLLVQFLQPVQLGRRVLLEARRHVRLPALEDDFHARTPLHPECGSSTRPADLVFDPTSACRGFRGQLLPLPAFSRTWGHPVPGTRQVLHLN